MCLMACSDEITSTFSNKYRVMCNFRLVERNELFLTIGNTGHFAIIRKSGSKIVMKSVTSENSYNMLETEKYFQFGLGGLIVGTAYSGELKAYDLACRNCDRIDKRMTIVDNIYAECSHCGIVYNLNNDGSLHKVPKDCIHTKPKGLYRYQIEQLGEYVSIHN